MKITYQAKVNNNGTLKIHNKDRFISDLENFIGMDVVISLEKKKNKRSNQQNRAYRGYILPMVHLGLKDLGWQVSLEWTHLHLREKFLKSELVNEKTGEVISYIKSTTDLSTIEFNEFIANIQQYGATNIGINIPDPNSQVDIDFNN